MFLVEQNAFHALKLAHRGYVMVNGRITMSGTGRELLGARGSARRLSRRRPALRRRNDAGAIFERGFCDFLLVTVVLGGGAAFLTGRAVGGHLAAGRLARPLRRAPRLRRCASSTSPCSRARFCRLQYFAALDFAVVDSRALARAAGFQVTRAAPDGAPVFLALRARRAVLLARCDQNRREFRLESPYLSANESRFPAAPGGAFCAVEPGSDPASARRWRVTDNSRGSTS